MGKQIELTNVELESLTDEELKVLEEAGLIKMEKGEKPKVKKEIRTK